MITRGVFRIDGPVIANFTHYNNGAYPTQSITAHLDAAADAQAERSRQQAIADFKTQPKRRTAQQARQEMIERMKNAHKATR